MSVDAPLTQVEAAARRAGLAALFGLVLPDPVGVAGLDAGGEGEVVEVGFANADGPVGVLLLELDDSGDPHDTGLTVGLRGWRLNEDVASV